jgi:hypothetical protein
MQNLIWHLMASSTDMIIFPALGLAQFGSIAGTVRDNTGDLLLGVMGEASSPAQIENSRTAVSDGTGQYRIEQLRPRTYPVTSTLSDFNAFIRDNVDISADFTGPINAALNVSYASNVRVNYTITSPLPRWPADCFSRRHTFPLLPPKAAWSDWVNQVDLRVTGIIQIKEEADLELAADLYNLFNLNSVPTRNQAAGPSYYVPETILAGEYVLVQGDPEMRKVRNQ